MQLSMWMKMSMAVMLTSVLARLCVVKMKGRNTSYMQEGGAHDLKFRSRVTTLSTRFAVENDKAIGVNMTWLKDPGRTHHCEILSLLPKKHARS